MKTNIIFFIISLSVLLRMRNVSDKCCRENQKTNFVFRNFFFDTLLVISHFACKKSRLPFEGFSWNFTFENLSKICRESKSFVCFLLGYSPASEFCVPTFRTHPVCSIFIGRCLCEEHNHLPMKIEQTECSDKSEHKIQTPGNNPEESILHLEHGECLKSRK